MRVLMLSQFYPPIIGGEEQHVRALGRALVERGHSVAVATLWHEGLPELELDGEVRVYRVWSSVGRLAALFSSERRFAPPAPDPEATLALRRLIARERPDVVHAHNWLVHSFLPLNTRRQLPLVQSLHNYHRVCPTVTLMRDGALCDGPGLARCLGCAGQHYGSAKGTVTTIAHTLTRPWLRAAVDIYLPVSQAVARGNRLESSGLPYEVVPNFIGDEIGVADAETEPPEVASYVAQLPAGDFILFAGALARLKGVEVLLRAYAGLADAPPLVLIGYPKPEEPLPSPLPPNVHVLEDWPRTAVLAAWRRALFGVVPSLWAEPCPTVSLEAMACGRAVVGSRIGGLVDQIVDGETGTLVEAGDVAALRAAMAQLLAHPEERARMGVAARRRVRTFRAATVVPHIESIYAQLLGRGQTGQSRGA